MAHVGAWVRVGIVVGHAPLQIVIVGDGVGVSVVAGVVVGAQKQGSSAQAQTSNRLPLESWRA